MSKLDTLLLEALLFKDKDKAPPSKKATGVSLKQYIKLKKEFDEFQKMLKEEEDKKKPKDGDKLTFWHKVVLMHIGALAYFATLALLFRLTFH